MARKRSKHKRKARAANELEVRPTAERFQHDNIIRAKGSRTAGDVAPFRVITQNQLDRYLVRRQIDDAQYASGMTLYSEWRGSGCEPKLIGSYGVRFDAPPDISTHQAVLRKLVTDALVDVGRLCSHILVHVCLCNESARDWAKGRGLPDHVARTYGIWLLRDALTSLTLHYEQRAKRRRR